MKFMLSSQHFLAVRSSASVTLVVGWDEMEKGGYLQLQKAELEEFVVTTGSSRKHIISGS